MIYYKLILSCETERSLEKNEKKDEDPIQEKVEDQLKIFNEKHLGHSIDCESAFVYYYADDRMNVAILHEIDAAPVYDLAEEIREEISDINGIIRADIVSIEEITVRDMKTIFEESSISDYSHYRRSSRSYSRNWNFVCTCGFEIEEEVIDDKPLSADDAETALDELMADKTLREETDRIYDENNQKEFYGYPVHYTIIANNREAAKDIAKYMVRALHSNNRLPGTRLTVISEVEITRYDSDMEKWLQNSSGTAVLVELQNERDADQYASELTRTGIIMSGFIKRFHRDTLFFLYKNKEADGFGDEVISRLENDMDILEIREGRGKKDEACAYMERAIRESRYKDLMDESAFSYLKKKKSFHASDVRDAVDEWEKMCLKEKAYVSYGKCVKKKRSKKRKEKKDAYGQLQKMIGLDEVKSVIDDLLAYYRLQKEREKHFKCDMGISRHMVFTGNPGCAKTTVARLLADIMLEEGILTSGKFVECGRGDLVGKYVGWTARIVQDKFRMARGGILFIDEAYALVEDHRTYGDEAINTIVQEMENHRDDVIVIFAGYPDPMKEFINRNEGLKSRIAFHIDFPDYNEDEMMDILSLMIEERGFCMDTSGEEKCRDIFRDAISRENFGNGRYARNLLEYAMMKQAGRLAGKGLRKEYSKERITQLIADDFEDDFMPDVESSRKLKLGFGT